MRKQLMTAIAAILFFAGLNSAAPTVRAAGTCNLQTIKGSYGGLVTGSGFGILVAGAPVITFDGAGSLTGNDVVSFGGSISPSTLTGTYTVDADCTGTMTNTFDNGFTLTSRIVIVDNGKEILMLVTTPGGVTTGDLKRQ